MEAWEESHDTSGDLLELDPTEAFRSTATWWCSWVFLTLSIMVDMSVARGRAGACSSACTVATMFFAVAFGRAADGCASCEAP